jgi:LysR family transcriptional regulator, low CO2-responsive transcriptional regulator
MNQLMQDATLHQMRVFAAVVRNHSFTRAAKELFLTQPTVSMQVKHLSRTVGFPLFEQVGRKLYLTQAGRELYETCRDVFERMAQFEITLADLQGLKQGNLRIAVVTTAKYVIPRILGLFCQRYPSIDISLTVENHQQIMDGFLTNQNDLYILSQIPEDIDVTVEPFLENPLVVLAARDNPLTKENFISLERLSKEPFIMRERGSGTREEVERVFDARRLPLKVRLDMGSNEAIKQAVAGGLGVSVLSKHALVLDSQNSNLAVLDVQSFPIQRHWYVMYPSTKKLSAIATVFHDYLLNEGKQIAQNAAL